MKFASRRSWVSAGLVIGLSFVAIQFVPYGRVHVNPPVSAEPRWDSLQTRALARRACFDCHSNETEWPAYSHVAPVSWLVHRDVSKGRAELNFSEWHRPQKEANDAAEDVMTGEMPLPLYRIMHGHARLTADERAQLARGLDRTIGHAGGAAGDER